MTIDIAVVGAGPIGLAAARAAAASGARPVVFEQRAEGSSSSCCAGLVSRRTLATLGVSENAVLREIRAVRVHVPGGKEIELRSQEVKAVVVDRATLEAELLLRAREEGVEVRFQSTVIGARPGLLAVRSDAQADELPVSVIIGADGPRSRIAEWLSLGRPDAYVCAAQVDVDAPSIVADCVEVFVGESVAPGFFAWRLPAEGGIARIGIGVMPPHSPTAYLERLLSRSFPSARIRSRCAGVIPLSPPLRTASPGVLLVGDAAGHVKPLSGGGLYTGGVCARLAGEAAARSVSASRGELRDEFEDYPGRCLEAIGKELAFGRSVRHHLSSLRDPDLCAAAGALDQSPLVQFVADHADIDSFHRLPDVLAGEPGFWTTVLRIAPLLGSHHS